MFHLIWRPTYLVLLFCFFFFKQKTAYEMRISDWSSDVCSSDLAGVAVVAAPYRTPLLTIGALCLIAGAVLLTRQQLIAARCGAGGVCTPRWMRIGTLVGLIVGVALLWAGYTYV